MANSQKDTKRVTTTNG